MTLNQAEQATHAARARTQRQRVTRDAWLEMADTLEQYSNPNSELGRGMRDREIARMRAEAAEVQT